MIGAMGYEHILVEIEAPIATVTLNRPKVLNALSPELIRELTTALTELDADDSVRAVVLTGGPKVFAAGADIGDMADRGPVEQLRRDQTGRWISLAGFSKPLIAAVNGYALGGGCEVMLMCDLIVAGESARLGQPEINLGVIPGAGGTQRWPRTAGKYAAMAVMLTGVPVTAERAYQLGIVNKVVPSEMTIEVAKRLARQLAEKPPLAARMAKEAVLKAYEAPLSEGLASERKSFYFLFASEDQKEGMHAFLEQHINVETEGAIGWIRLNRPEKMNAIGALTRQQLGDAIKQAERADDVRVVVLTGTGRAFSSGADVTEMISGGGMRTPEDVGNVLRNEYMPMLNRLRTMPKPVIAAMNGPAVGIGASFALACDIRIATPEAYILEAFVNIGLAPDGGVSWLLPRLAGTGVAYEMFFTGKPLSAEDAHRLGVINRVVPADRLEEEVRDLANQLVSQPRQALAGAKRAVNHALTSSYEDAMEFESYLQEAQVGSPEFAEGVQNFLARRAKK